MTLGLQPLNKTPGRAVIRLLEAAASSAAPTVADTANQQGAPTSNRGARIQLPGRADPIERALLHFYNTAGSGVVSCSYLKMWGWTSNAGLWTPPGTGTDANKGKINVAGSYTFGEVAADRILHIEPFLYAGYFDYLTAELGTVTGSADSGAGALTIDVVAADKTFTRGSGSFLTDGFAAGQTVTTSGFTNSGNNGTKVIATVTATVMTMTSATGLADESGNNNERVVDQAVALFNLDLIVPINGARR